MKHSEFIEKMKRRTKRGKPFKFELRHANDPQIAWLGDEQHSTVLQIASLIDVSESRKLRSCLIGLFQVSTEGPIKNRPKWTDAPFSKRIVKLLLNVSKLKWGELDGNPIVHWSEKP